ncbi:hypothetical protein HSTV1_20 [Haloarcula sinaiiensis tailed virus 1]|uniref:Uncharacterized protein n=1 Tax=Haloarcula sinaiiensis tailed virus 1 TaxID=1262530 RepID=R9QTN0_9CAUD|nr:hypothetical protein HSTV1_20 [Haloarcula sinaiiensis tailed virus 1]AGC34565.1 hypothetical protein HSTV1_20 [Haloarcula sinaiiensis tailed virus 1]
MLVRFDLDKLEDELGDEVQRFIVEFASELVNQLKQEAPVGATGDLQRSIQIFRTGGGQVLLGTRLSYAMDVWQGQPPHTPDFEAIEVWARRKLGDEDLAGPVFRSIQKSGTEPNDFVGRSIDNAIQRIA